MMCKTAEILGLGVVQLSQYFKVEERNESSPLPGSNISGLFISSLFLFGYIFGQKHAYILTHGSEEPSSALII